jgi:hypothetical protein
MRRGYIRNNREFSSLHWSSTTSEGPGRSSSNHSCFSERLQSGKVASIRDYSVLLSRRPHHGSYALRISSKRLGPVNEFLGLARSQIEIELNSTTDDLLIDVANNKIPHPLWRKFPSIFDNFVNREDEIVPRQNWKTTLCSKHRVSGCRRSLQPSAASRS